MRAQLHGAAVRGVPVQLQPAHAVLDRAPVQLLGVPGVQAGWQGLTDIARHVIQRTLTARLLSYMTPYDVASNRAWQILLSRPSDALCILVS